jgi:hypothetical protein
VKHMYKIYRENSTTTFWRQNDNQPTQCFNSYIQGGLNKGFQQIVESFFVFNPIAPQVQKLTSHETSQLQT